MSTPVDIVITAIKVAKRPSRKKPIFFWAKRILEAILGSKYNFQVIVG
jgi:hypothetical protein